MHSCTIYLDDVDIQTLGVYIDDSFSMPMFNIDHINSISIPGRPGELYYNDKPGPIVFKIPLYSISDDELERQNIMRRFKKLLIDNYGKSKIVKLKNSQEPDIYYNVRLSSSNDMDKELHQIGEFDLELTCYDGYGQLVQEDTLLWGDTVVPLGSFNYDFNATGNEKVKTFTSNGTMDFVINGYNTVPYITLIGSGTNIYLSINGVVSRIPSLNNQTVVVKGIEKSVLVDGVFNMDIFSDINWIDYYLKAGTNNVVITGNSLNVQLAIDFEERFY
ncbi:phage tail family protein [Macrococcus capreoli]